MKLEIQNKQESEHFDKNFWLYHEINQTVLLHLSIQKIDDYTRYYFTNRLLTFRR